MIEDRALHSLSARGKNPAVFVCIHIMSLMPPSHMVLGDKRMGSHTVLLLGSNCSQLIRKQNPKLNENKVSKNTFVEISDIL